MTNDLPVMSFATRPELRAWLLERHRDSRGIYVRLFKARSGVPSVTFEDVLDEGLCFGWSESKRLAFDAQSYLQRFTPRASVGTTSARNIAHAKALEAAGLMMPAGRAALNAPTNRPD